MATDCDLKPCPANSPASVSPSTVTSGSVTTTTTYTYEGLSLLSLAATQSTGTTYSVSYLYDAQARPYAGVYASGAATPTLFQVVTTDRGDVVELLDIAGTAFAAYRYDAWGVPTETTSTAAGTITSAVAAAIASRQPLRYAGYAYDEHSGLYYLSARSYDPVTRQFLSKDPAKDDGEESAYQYCGGDPVGKVDPTGLVVRRIRSYWESLVANQPGWWNFYGRYKYWLNYRSYLQKAMAKMAKYYYENRYGAERWSYDELNAQIDSFNSVTKGMWFYFERCRYSASYSWFRSQVKGKAYWNAVAVGDALSYSTMAVGFLQNLSVAGIRSYYALPTAWWR